MDTANLKDFTFDPYVSKRKVIENEDGTLTLRVTTKSGTGREMPGSITVPKHMANSVLQCLYDCGEAVQGKAEIVDGDLVMRLIFESALWTDMTNWFDYVTLELVDMYGEPLKKPA